MCFINKRSWGKSRKWETLGGGCSDLGEREWWFGPGYVGRDGEQWSDLRYILVVEPLGFADGRCEGKGIKCGPTGLGPGSNGSLKSSTEMAEIKGFMGASAVRRIRSSVLGLYV